MNVDAVVPEVAIGRRLDGKVTMIIVDRVGAHTTTTTLTFTPEGARWAASELSRAAGDVPRTDSVTTPGPKVGHELSFFAPGVPFAKPISARLRCDRCADDLPCPEHDGKDPETPTPKETK